MGNPDVQNRMPNWIFPFQKLFPSSLESEHLSLATTYILSEEEIKLENSMFLKYW